MRIDRIVDVKANVDTDHTQTLAVNLAANVIIEGSSSGAVGEVQEYPFGIHVITQNEIDALEAKRLVALADHDAAMVAWHVVENKRLAAIEAHETALAAWQVAYDAGEATLEQKPQMIPWPQQAQPVYLEPIDNSNLGRVRAAVQAWLDAGNSVSAYVPPSQEELRAFMEPLTRIQFRRGLLRADQIIPGKPKIRASDIEALIAAIADDDAREDAEIQWQDATRFERLNDLVLTLSTALGFSPEEVDTLWNEALNL